MKVLAVGLAALMLTGIAAAQPTHHAKAPVIDTTLLPAGGFGRPHTITGGF